MVGEDYNPENKKANKKLMVRELMGERTGNVNAQELAETWKKSS